MGRDDRYEAEFEGFAEQVRRAYERAPAPEVMDRHLAAMAEEMAALDPAEAFSPAIPRRKNMVSAILSTVAGKVAAAALGLTVATGAAASAGVLPDAAQEAVSNAAARVGISIPDPSDDANVASEDVESEDEGSTGDEGRRVDGDVKSVLEDDTLEGRDKGEAVSDAASQNRQDADRAPSDPGPGSNPTGNGADSNPSDTAGDDSGAGSDQADEGQSNNPTGYGRP